MLLSLLYCRQRRRRRKLYNMKKLRSSWRLWENVHSLHDAYSVSRYINMQRGGRSFIWIYDFSAQMTCVASTVTFMIITWASIFYFRSWIRRLWNEICIVEVTWMKFDQDESREQWRDEREWMSWEAKPEDLICCLIKERGIKLIHERCKE